MTARRPAYAEALRRAASMPSDEVGTPVAAGPRPRSRFEEVWEETAIDQPQAVAGVLPAAAAEREPLARVMEREADISPVPVETPETSGGLPPAEEPDLPEALVVSPESAADPVAPTAPPTPVEVEIPFPFRVPVPVGQPPVAVPVVRVITTPAPAEHTVPPAPPFVTEPAEPVASIGTVFTPVRAEPTPPPAERPQQPQTVERQPPPLVIEIGRIEVRVAADPPAPVPRRERAARPGPALEDYLATGRATT